MLRLGFVRWAINGVHRSAAAGEALIRPAEARLGLGRSGRQGVYEMKRAVLLLLGLGDLGFDFWRAGRPVPSVEIATRMPRLEK